MYDRKTGKGWTRYFVGYMCRTGKGTDLMQDAFMTKVWGIGNMKGVGALGNRQRCPYPDIYIFLAINYMVFRTSTRLPMSCNGKKILSFVVRTDFFPYPIAQIIAWTFTWMYILYMDVCR